MPGVDNAPAVLHRPRNMPPFLDTKALSASQVACSKVAALASDPRFQVVRRLLASSRVLLCSTSTGMDRPLLPPAFRHRAFDALHALYHPGVRVSRCLLSSRFLWPGMNKDVGLRVACTANEPRWPDTCACLFNALMCLLGVSHTSTWTWWDLCLLYAATLTCSL